MRFDERYAEEATLKDGTKVTIRFVRPDDAPILEKGFAKLSPGTRYQRFFASKKRLSHDELDYLTHPDGVHHVAIGATTAAGEGAGVARFFVSGDGAAEAAVVVTDELQGKGLGTLLLARLGAAALERGITRFEAEVLATNDAMVRLAKSLGKTTITPGAAGIAKVEVDLLQPSALAVKSDLA